MSDATKLLPDGIYPDLPLAAYLAQPRLSSSGVKDLMVSPLTFWHRSWMNPELEREETDATSLGTAYHKRIVEGREAFYGAYAPYLDDAAHPGALRTADEIKDRIRALNETRDKADRIALGGTKGELVERLLEAEPGVEIWDELVTDYRNQNPGKEFINHGAIAKIERAAAMVEKHPQLGKAFTGGVAELTILWTCERTGVPMKCRPDYLKARAIVDLKTFSNPLDKSIDRAIVADIAARRYFVQMALVDEGVCAMRRLNVPDELAHLASDAERTLLWVFQDTTTQLARGKVLPRGTVFQIGQQTVEAAKETFRHYTDSLGADPWLDFSDIETLDDGIFPAWTGEA